MRGTAFSVIFSGDGGCICTCSGKVEVAMIAGQTIDVSAKYVPIIADEPAPKGTVVIPSAGRERYKI